MNITPVAEGLVNDDLSAFVEREEFRSGAVGRGFDVDDALCDDGLFADVIAAVETSCVRARAY